MSPRKTAENQIRDGYHEYGEVRCPSCGVVDLSDADDVSEAIELWYSHVRENHDTGTTQGTEPEK
jgi:hypothetical protein